MSIEATILVQFNGDETDYQGFVELDDISNIDINDNVISTFPPNSEAILRSHFSSNVKVVDIVATDGSIVFLHNDERTVKQQLLFASRNIDEPTEHTLSVVPLTSSIEYLGRPGSYETSNLNGGAVKFIGDVNMTPFLMDVESTYKVALYRLTPPSLDLDEDEIYNIGIVVYLEAVE